MSDETTNKAQGAGNKMTEAVREHYAAVARGEAKAAGLPSAEVARSVGYSAEEVALGEGANLGLGCGNPTALSGIAEGMTVLDLGSGAGFDAFLAWRKVGAKGRVIGVDMTDEMLTLARANASKLGASNVEFRKGFIEKLPVESNSVDYAISNCVINLSADKAAVFAEIARVLKPGGRFAVSDIVLLKPLPEELRRDVSAYVGCISGALPVGEYLLTALRAGLSELSIPRLAHGAELVKVLSPVSPAQSCCGNAEGAAGEGKLASSCCCGSTITIKSLKNPALLQKEAAEATASINLHGKKAQ
jgi:SAM-dependent methyltransferase